MKKFLFGWFVAFAVLGLVGESVASTLYVDLNSTNPVAPYSSWGNAATTIQSAVDAAVNGDTVSVTNGHYLLWTEITVGGNITIQSVNGPDTTIVDGDGTDRCFNLGSSSCTISGFTITNGYASGNTPDNYGGGVYCGDLIPVVSNCIVIGNFAAKGGGMHKGTANNCSFINNTGTLSGGGMCYGTVSNCTFIGNWAQSAGGVFDGTANDCTFSSNSVSLNGGGMHGGTATNCTFTGNSASENGGGAAHCTANNCVFIENSSNGDWKAGGGGMYYGTANNCIFTGNSAFDKGGGMIGGTANGCAFTGNFASFGGGTASATANGCTLTDNSSDWDGGGMYGGKANNCVVWYNLASQDGNDLHGTSAHFTCSPDVTDGVEGCITNAPWLASASHLAAGSPCIGAGGGGGHAIRDRNGY